MHSPLFSPPPGAQPRPYSSHDAAQTQRYDALRRAARRAQYGFLAVNVPPLTVGILVLPSTEIASVHVVGHLTVGLAWGILQCGLFVAGAWWYERTCTRVCDPLMQSLISSAPGARATGATESADRYGW